MKASILIPAYNAAEFIGDTLASCVQQGVGCIEEIIVINDQSEDDTRGVVERFQAKHSDFRIILEDNPTKGACAARNHALNLAKGDAVQWLDADDLLGERKLEAQLKLLNQNPQHLIASKWRRFAGDLTNLWPEEQGAWSHVPNQSSPREWLLAERMMIPAGWLGSRQLFESIQPWDTSLLINQDGEYFTRAIVASAGVILEPERRVYYRSELKRSVSQFKPHKASSLFASVESFEQTVLQLGNDSAIKTLISNHYMGFIYRVYPLVPELRKKARAKIKQYGKPTRQNDVAESNVSRLICFIFGWKFLVQLRLLINPRQV
jgi:glycosyltransferase involved in cell wall biosynthesis